MELSRPICIGSGHTTSLSNGTPEVLEQIKKAMVSFHSLLRISPVKSAETKRPWETLKSAMAFNSNSNTYIGAGQTPPSFFSQHHQFILCNSIIFSTLIRFEALH